MMVGGREEVREEREVEKKPRGQVDVVGSVQVSWRGMIAGDSTTVRYA